MKLKDIIDEISNVEGIDKQEALDMEVEFCVLRKSIHDEGEILLLDTYEYNGKIFIDIGTAEDDKKRLSEIS